jgi:hypothetical protein
LGGFGDGGGLVVSGLTIPWVGNLRIVMCIYGYEWRETKAEGPLIMGSLIYTTDVKLRHHVPISFIPFTFSFSPTSTPPSPPYLSFRATTVSAFLKHPPTAFFNPHHPQYLSKKKLHISEP